MSFVGAVIALLTLANVMALANWHVSLLDHDDLAIYSAVADDELHHHHDISEDQSTAGSGTVEQDSRAIALHALTHAMVHGLADLASNISISIVSHETASDWFTNSSFTLSGTSPEALLRPPRF